MACPRWPRCGGRWPPGRWLATQLIMITHRVSCMPRPTRVPDGSRRFPSVPDDQGYPVPSSPHETTIGAPAGTAPINGWAWAGPFGSRGATEVRGRQTDGAPRACERETDAHRELIAGVLVGGHGVDGGWRGPSRRGPQGPRSSGAASGCACRASPLLGQRVVQRLVQRLRALGEETG